MAIEKLSTGKPTAASQIPFYDDANGRDARCSGTELAALLQTLLTAAGVPISQYAAPTTGQTVTVTPPTTGASMFLLLSPAGTLAALTIALPVGADGQEVIVHTRQTLTALTLTPQPSDANSGAPTTLAAGGFFHMRYDAINKLWCRIG